MLLLPLFVDLRLYLSVLFELGLLSFCFLLSGSQSISQRLLFGG